MLSLHTTVEFLHAVGMQSSGSLSGFGDWRLVKSLSTEAEVITAIPRMVTTSILRFRTGRRKEQRMRQFNATWWFEMVLQRDATTFILRTVRPRVIRYFKQDSLPIGFN
jgi:hypothetical protein